VDNLTHSLAGLIIADAALALRQRSAAPPPPQRFRAAALATSVFANNAPDLDFVYTGITNGRLGYLLHHRGHTHTLVAVLPLALLAYGLGLLVSRLGPRSPASADRGTLAGLAVLGGLVHVAFDFCNNYGVHPFWPVYSGWFYGDAIFIVDPWLMLIGIGMALGVSPSPILRGLLLVGLAALLALAWLSGLGGVRLAIALTIASFVWVPLLWRAPFAMRWAVGGSALLALGVALLATRHTVRSSARDALATAGPGFTLVDLVSTPAPGNPMCWTLLAVQASEDAYVVRQGLASGWPWLSGARACPAMSRSQTAPLARPSAAPPDERRLVWTSEFRAPRARLESVQQADCTARAFLRFARVPFWVEHGERPELIGDLRFDRSSALEFAELPLQAGSPCPRFEPPWLPPLALPPLATESVAATRSLDDERPRAD
jgi:inner membrane protein